MGVRTIRRDPSDASSSRSRPPSCDGLGAPATLLSDGAVAREGLASASEAVSGSCEVTMFHWAACVPVTDAIAAIDASDMSCDCGKWLLSSSPCARRSSQTFSRYSPQALSATRSSSGTMMSCRTDVSAGDSSSTGVVGGTTSNTKLGAGEGEDDAAAAAAAVRLPARPGVVLEEEAACSALALDSSAASAAPVPRRVLPFPLPLPEALFPRPPLDDKLFAPPAAVERLPRPRGDARTGAVSEGGELVDNPRRADWLRELEAERGMDPATSERVNKDAVGPDSSLDWPPEDDPPAATATPAPSEEWTQLMPYHAARARSGVPDSLGTAGEGNPTLCPYATAEGDTIVPATPLNSENGVPDGVLPAGHLRGGLRSTLPTLPSASASTSSPSAASSPAYLSPGLPAAAAPFCCRCAAAPCHDAPGEDAMSANTPKRGSMEENEFDATGTSCPVDCSFEDKAAGISAAGDDADCPAEEFGAADEGGTPLSLRASLLRVEDRRLAPPSADIGSFAPSPSGSSSSSSSPAALSRPSGIFSDKSAPARTELPPGDAKLSGVNDAA